MSYFSSQVQPFIRAFIISDGMLYSALNLINILFVLYVTTTVPGGTVSSATAIIAVGLAARIIVELAIGKMNSRLAERQQLLFIMAGLAAISVSYAGFALTHSALGLALLWVLNGVGWAIGHPTKLALVAKYINHEQASQEWGVTDALNISLVIAIMFAGAYVVDKYSFAVLFALAATINTLGIVPFAWYFWSRTKQPLPEPVPVKITD